MHEFFIWPFYHFYHGQHILHSKHSRWWRRLEKVLKTSYLFKTSSRCLDQDEYVCLSHTPSEDVFKMSSKLLDQDQHIRLGHTSSKRLQDVLQNLFQDIFTTSSRRLQDISKTSCQDISKKSCQDVFNISLKLLQEVLQKHLQDIFKTSCKDAIKTFSRRFQDVFKTSCKNVFKTSSRRFQNVLKTSSRCLQDISKTSCQDVFKTSSNLLQDVLQKRLQDRRSLQDVLKTLQICLQDVFKTYHQVELFLLTRFRDAFSTLLRRSGKTVYLQKDLPRSHFWEICGQCTKFSRVIKISQVLVFTLLNLLVATYRDVFRTWSNIYNGAFSAKMFNGFKLLTIFVKKAPSQMFDWVKSKLLTKGLKYWAHSCSQSTNYAEKILNWKKMCDIVFESQKVLVGQKIEGVFMQKQPSEMFFKKGVMRNFAEFARNICAGNS